MYNTHKSTFPSKSSIKCNMLRCMDVESASCCIAWTLLEVDEMTAEATGVLADEAASDLDLTAWDAKLRWMQIDAAAREAAIAAAKRTLCEQRHSHQQELARSTGPVACAADARCSSNGGIGRFQLRVAQVCTDFRVVNPV